MQGCFLAGDDMAVVAVADNTGDLRKTRLRPFRRGVESTTYIKNNKFW